MLKGIRKNILVIKCDRNSPFESAMFILKENAQNTTVNNDIIAEAEGIIESAFSDHENGKITRKAKKNKKRQGLG